MPTQPTIGVLALQGDFAAHARRLAQLNCPWREVRTPQQLATVAGIILPGGESTTLLKLLASSGLDAAIQDFHRVGRPIFGTCAGVILLARHVANPEQNSLGILQVSVERNSYGRQVDSFETRGRWTGLGGPKSIEMLFIRAPRITRIEAGVEVLATHGDETALVQQANVLGATFHPELTGDYTVHEHFVEMCRH